MTHPDGKNWFNRMWLDRSLTRLTEPFVHEYFRSNIYFLAGRDRDLVVDTGMGIRPLFPALPLTPGKPVIVVATHIHVDHVGGLHEFDERAGPRIEAGAFATMDDAATLAGLFRSQEGAVAQVPEAGWLAANFRLTPAPLTRLLDAGDLVDLGDRAFRVLHLPGHSPGSIGLFDERDGVLFSGDAIYPGGLVDDLPGSDPAIYRVTMQRLIELPVRIVHGGHDDSLTAPAMREIARSYLDTGRG